MIPLALRKNLAPLAQRFMTGLSSQLKRFATPLRSQALAAGAASHPRGLVLKKMPAFSALLEEAQASSPTKPQALALAQTVSHTEPRVLLQGPSAQSPSNTSRNYIEYTVKPGDTLWGLGVKKFAVDPQVLARKNSIENPRELKPGQRLKIPVRTSSAEQTVVASWYGHEHHGKPMANGEPFNMHAATIAHKDLPLGTKVEIRNPETGQKVVATVTDRGPYIEGRDVDLSYALAKRLNMVEKGVGKLLMRVLA